MSTGTWDLLNMIVFNAQETLNCFKNLIKNEKLLNKIGQLFTK